MAVVGDNNFIRYVYRGEEGEIIPREATHIIVEARVVLARAFREHRNIVEVICHEGVEKIEDMAFYGCPNLRRVVMPGVKVVEMLTFFKCDALTDVECGKHSTSVRASHLKNDCRPINLTPGMITLLKLRHQRNDSHSIFSTPS